MVQQLIMSCSPSDACELTPDPSTANGRLSLSEDNRKVTRVREQTYPDHPERFKFWSQVLGRESYWPLLLGGREGKRCLYRSDIQKNHKERRG